MTLEINTLGDAAERAAHRAELIAYLEKHQNILDEDGKRRMYANPLARTGYQEPGHAGDG